MFGRGMPLNHSWLTGTYMYEQTFLRGDVDYGSMIAVVIVALGVLLANVTNKALRKADY
jgi:raffinose/stachyose/melibiose transport system permease protein